MQNLSWNEVQDRAIEFSAKWQGETYEKGESQSFWSDFLQVFGVDRRRHGAFFEYAIKKNGGKQGFIDLFWPGKLLAEQKSAGRDLTKAQVQARGYLHSMPDHDLPVGIVVSDFATFEYVDLATDEVTAFPLVDLPKHIKLFGFLNGEHSRKLAEQNPVNRQAAEAMAALHNELRDSGYAGHDLELLLVRLVFCMFADDSGIFARGSFEDFVYNRTDIGGSDLGARLVQLFQVLNTPHERRSPNLDQSLVTFEYINGGLFAESMAIPDFNHRMRDALLKAMALDWSLVSPAIFGSMFQGVMDETERRNLGAHYTSEENILKLIKPLFLDDLYDEFAQCRRGSNLREFHDKLKNLRFLDPACGCGNFLVITYRELRRLEHKVLEALYGKQRGMFDLDPSAGGLIEVNVDQMYGIEIEEFPALIAQTALWLTDHQMNMEFSSESGKAFKRIPLIASATIVHGNALTLPWEDIITPDKLHFILGNPPFIGHQWRTEAQVKNMHEIWGTSGAYNRLDFVTCWYKKAAEFMRKNPRIQTALVATNSISQGEQVSPLWEKLHEMGMHINFAHRTFQWSNDAKGVAAVHCVIEGFSPTSKLRKRLFSYPDIKGEPIETQAKNINGYLVNAPNVFIASRSKPPTGMPLMTKGSQPTDGGFLILTPEERDELLVKEPVAAKWIHEFIGGEELLNARKRYCLWLKHCPPEELKSMPHVMERLQGVKDARTKSSTPSVRACAAYPTLFTQDRQPASEYLAMPRVSSERRNYIPVVYLTPDIIAHEKLIIIPHATMYIFGILESAMHMAWMRVVAGRLESRYSYSPAIYNNFPWPEVDEVKRTEVERLARAVLDARAEFPGASLADLYDPLTMPPVLAKAHHVLDRYVDRLYSPAGFPDDAARVSHLFTHYQEKSSEA